MAKRFTVPPQELIDRWISESDGRPTTQTAWSFVVEKAARWGFDRAKEPDPEGIKGKALRALARIEALEIVSVWIGRDAIASIKTALNSIPND